MVWVTVSTGVCKTGGRATGGAGAGSCRPAGRGWRAGWSERAGATRAAPRRAALPGGWWPAGCRRARARRAVPSRRPAARGRRWASGRVRREASVRCHRWTAAERRAGRPARRRGDQARAPGRRESSGRRAEGTTSSGRAPGRPAWARAPGQSPSGRAPGPRPSGRAPGQRGEAPSLPARESSERAAPESTPGRSGRRELRGAQTRGPGR